MNISDIRTGKIYRGDASVTIRNSFGNETQPTIKEYNKGEGTFGNESDVFNLYKEDSRHISEFTTLIKQTDNKYVCEVLKLQTQRVTETLYFDEPYDRGYERVENMFNVMFKEHPEKVDSINRMIEEFIEGNNKNDLLILPETNLTDTARVSYNKLISFIMYSFRGIEGAKRDLLVKLGLYVSPNISDPYDKEGREDKRRSLIILTSKGLVSLTFNGTNITTLSDGGQFKSFLLRDDSYDFKLKPSIHAQVFQCGFIDQEVSVLSKDEAYKVIEESTYGVEMYEGVEKALFTEGTHYINVEEAYYWRYSGEGYSRMKYTMGE